VSWASTSLALVAAYRRRIADLSERRKRRLDPLHRFHRRLAGRNLLLITFVGLAIMPLTAPTRLAWWLDHRRLQRQFSRQMRRKLGR
jgi:hypothetical protein